MRILEIYILLILFLLLNCNKTQSTQPQNSPPVIDRIQVEPDEPKINQVVKITSFASDADKHELFFRWSVSRGTLTNEGIGNPIYWSTPNNSGNVTIVSMVYDGIDLVTKSIGINVSDDSDTIE